MLDDLFPDGVSEGPVRWGQRLPIAAPPAFKAPLQEPDDEPDTWDPEPIQRRPAREEKPEQGEPEEEPWAASVLCARVRVGIRWPDGPRSWRGALIHALMPRLPGGEHSDWTGRDEGYQTMMRPPPVCYRVHRDAPEVFFCGERAHMHALAMLRFLEGVSTPEGKRIPIHPSQMQMTVWEERVTIEAARWWAYETVTPIYPGKRNQGRRPRREGQHAQLWPSEQRPDLAQLAWASSGVQRSVMDRLVGFGLEPGRATVPVSVQLVHYKEMRNLTFERADRGIRDRNPGYHVRFLSNVCLPDGLGLASHASEGFGEIRRVEEV
jgi:hypothetical protein